VGDPIEHQPTAIERLRREVDLQFDLRDRAVTIAHRNIDKRLDAMNEFRAALNDQARSFVARSELDLRMENVNTRLSATEKFQNNLQGRIAVWGVVGGLIGSVVVSVVVFLILRVLR